MITQIEIDGFKSFKDFKVELAPFQVIVGPNGSGKSNLFDALHLLSRLADVDLRTAFQELRGDADELFTTLPNGQHVDRMRMAVEMLVDQNVHDDLGQKAQLQYTRLRYELEVTFKTDEYGLERPFIMHESLNAIPREKDSWCKKYNLSFQNGWLPEFTGNEKTFISTGDAHISAFESAKMVDLSLQALLINLHPDGQTRELVRQFNARDLQRTLLSAGLGTANDYFHVFAARESLRSWRLLHLNPEALREPSSVKDPTSLGKDGRNLPATLVRMQAEDEFVLADVSLDMANLVPGILKIRVEKNQARNEYDIWAIDGDGRSFSAQVLSDGTLRLLALATLRNDLQFHGVLCIEEPENGVHPLRFKRMAQLLREMATDFKDVQQVDEPLRQVLITTHSPAFISQPDVLDALLFAYTVTRVEPISSRNPSLEITRMTPVITLNTQLRPSDGIDEDKAIEAYTLNQVIKYLDSDTLDEARSQLEKSRKTL